LLIDDKQGLTGIREILNSNYSIANKITEVKEQQEAYVISNRPVRPKPEDQKKTKKDLSQFSKVISSESQLDAIISALESARPDLNAGNEIEINW